MRKQRVDRRNEQGAVILTAAMTLLFLLGFLGIALDFGHLFIVKTELQTATDSCALAASQELDLASDAVTRATSAGLTAGNLNKVNFQGASAGITAAEIVFSDTLTGAYSHTFPAATARYAKCTHTRSGMAPWILQAMSGFSGNASYRQTQGVYAQAVATRTSAQSACAIPVQITPKVGGAAPNYGFVPGEWISTLYSESSPNSVPDPGHFGWANLDGSTSATATKSELMGTGFCTLRTGDTIGTSGKKFAASVEWNSRFGLYKNGGGNPNPTTAPPDLTGYAYTAKNWPAQSSASADFLAKRATNRSYGNTVDSVNAGDAITGLNLKGGYKDAEMGTFAAGPRALATNGQDRRLVLAPIIVASTIAAWACVLMLHPIEGPNTTVYLEYVGNAAAASSPCASAGLAGGANGPRVPVLVQ
jgi:hypothetical protein